VGVDVENVTLGIMVEIPASAILIEDFIKAGIRFASFGTNDLIQYTIAVDRNNENVADMYQPKHPAVLYLIDSAIRMCRTYGVECSICGQAGSDPKMVEWLVEHGIASVSANIELSQRSARRSPARKSGSSLRQRETVMLNKGLSEEELFSFFVKKKEEDLDYNDILGSMCTMPHPVAVRVHNMFMETNLGDPGLFPGTTALEQLLIRRFADLFHRPFH
jgi:phosphoenolpyruvate-protein kinase (PTS system EI component)